MKKHNNKSYIKKYLKRLGIKPERTTNKNGDRVWSIKNKEYKTLVEITQDLKHLVFGI